MKYITYHVCFCRIYRMSVYKIAFEKKKEKIEYNSE